ncbi:MAG: DUF6429 family protein [Ruminococcus sp.]|nr:DUF6429 family protein [Ruminococcus sp.]
MKQNIEELTLLLHYLTSWENANELDETSFKYNFKETYFKAIEELTKKGYINSSSDKNSVTLTKDGERLAEELALKYLNK